MSAGATSQQGAPTHWFNQLFRHDATAGVILVSAALLALVMDNSPLYWLYDGLLSTPVVFQIGALELNKPLLLWINDGLMAIFFFLVGLEVKREILDGRLSSVKQASLPAIAAVGGMAIPALIYVAMTMDAGDPEALRGWAIPAATDIAFALGILALLGPRVPAALKVLLLAIAIIDDIGAIVIIAVFYTADLSLASLGLAAVGGVVLLAMNLAGVTRTTWYILVGVVMWVCVLKSGVHATLAGVVVALAIPMKGKSGETLLENLEHALHPWVAFGIMPIFAFANAGVSLAGMTFADLLSPIPLGIALGLFVGKQIGVFGSAYIAVKSGICSMPQGVNWMQIYGVSMLDGIGFTMSLFIGTLAFVDPEHASAVRIGVLVGSTFSAVLGYAVLRWATQPSGARAPAAD
jgi:NhaA family Na+:H+ antiporter